MESWSELWTKITKYDNLMKVERNITKDMKHIDKIPIKISVFPILKSIVKYLKSDGYPITQKNDQMGKTLHIGEPEQLRIWGDDFEYAITIKGNPNMEHLDKIVKQIKHIIKSTDKK